MTKSRKPQKVDLGDMVWAEWRPPVIVLSIEQDPLGKQDEIYLQPSGLKKLVAFIRKVAPELLEKPKKPG